MVIHLSTKVLHSNTLELSEPFENTFILPRFMGSPVLLFQIGEVRGLTIIHQNT